MKFQYYWHQLCDLKKCKEITDSLEKDGVFSENRDSPADGVIKSSDVSTISWKLTKGYLSDVEDFVNHINQEFFGFDIYRFNNHNMVLYNRYTEAKKAEYGWHYDGTLSTVLDYKLTAIVNLSDEAYEGGKFELFLTGGPKEIVEISTPGNIIIFPSWLYHRVTPVTAGVRKSLTLFFIGPSVR
jgi:PKHD-type hydroxylase